MEVPSEDEVEVVRDSRNARDAHASPFDIPRNWIGPSSSILRRMQTTTPVIDDDPEDDIEEVSSRRAGSSQATVQTLSSLDEDTIEEQLQNLGVPQLRYAPPFHRQRRPPATLQSLMPNLLPRNSTPVRLPVRPTRASRAPSLNATAKKPQHEGLKELNGILTRLSQQLHVLSQRRLAEKAAANASDDGPTPETCPICFEAFHCPGTCTTRCGHVFHRKCLDACLQNSRACPVCRASVHRAELIDLMSGFGELADSGEAVVDLINEPAQERGALDESILKTVQSVKESIDKAQAVDNLDSQIRAKNQLMEKTIETREKELEKQRKNFERHMEDEKGKLEKRKQRVQKGEETVAEKDHELNQALIEARKHESALQIREGEVEASAAENDRKRQKLEEQTSELNRKMRRMSEIRNKMNTQGLTGRPNELKERNAALERLLRRHGIPIPEDLEKEEAPKETPRKDAFMMDLGGDVTVVESPVKRRKVNAPAKAASLAFGGDLRKPSVYARPPPPRRGGVGIRSFAPEKKTASRIGGVAQRGVNCFTKKR